MIIPEWTTINIIVYAYLAVLAFGVAPLEYYGQAMMAYSKFRPAQGFPPRVGMFILYFLPLLVSHHFSAAVSRQPNYSPVDCSWRSGDSFFEACAGDSLPA